MLGETVGASCGGLLVAVCERLGIDIRRFERRDGLGRGEAAKGCVALILPQKKG